MGGRHALPQKLNIPLRQLRGRETGPQNIPDLHIIIDFKRLCHNVGAVKLLAYHAAADGVAVKADKHVKKSRAVADDKLFVAVDGA